jgi:hypothetical protein
MNLMFQKPGKALRRIAGWCGLLLYVGALSPVGVGLAEVIGTLDPNHEARIQMSADGAKVVLHHDAQCTSHRHGLLARTLTLFTATDRANEPDHVLQFSAAEIISGKPLPSAAPPIQLAHVCLLNGGLMAVTPGAHFPSSFPSHPSSGFSGRLLCLRSMLLLI